MPTADLKPCPFCGSEDLYPDFEGEVFDVVQCRACKTQGPWYLNGVGADEDWNSRPSPPLPGGTCRRPAAGLR